MSYEGDDTSPRPGATGATRVLIDREHPGIYRAQVEVARSVRSAVAQHGLDRRLVELVNVRVSQINRCAYCLDIHVRDALEAGETTQRLAVLPAWRDTELFSPTERAALILAESLTLLPDSRDLDYLEASQHLSPAQLSALSWVVIVMNAFNRISIVSQHRVPPRPGAQTHQSAPQTTTHGGTS